MRRLDCRLAKRLVAELRGGRKVEVRARSNLVTLSVLCPPHQCVVVVVVVVFTLKAVPVSTQYFLTSVLVQLQRR